MQNLATSLFTTSEWEAVANLLKHLSNEQTEWLANNILDISTADKSIVVEKRAVVAYGTETGNSKGIAQQFYEKAVHQNKSIELINLADFKLKQLKQINQLYIVCSTHGDGEPPEPIASFYDELIHLNEDLSYLSYAVLALGDSSYDHFCLTGITIDDRLRELNASPFTECVECDVDFEETAEEWITYCLPTLPNMTKNSEVLTKSRHKIRTSTYSKTSPLSVEVIKNTRLSDDSRSNPIHHLELQVPDNIQLSLTAGDGIGVLPQNPPQLVRQILSLTTFSGDESVVVKQRAVPLVEALREYCDLTLVTAQCLTKWSETSNNRDLIKLCQDKQTLRSYLKRHQLTDILVNHSLQLTPQQLVDSLRPLQPRLYDVANSTRQIQDELHLTVEKYRHSWSGKLQNGICSTYLTGIEEGENLLVFPHHNKRFHLPTNQNSPIILIADGTGIAPFRAFIQEIQSNPNREHSVWLILRERTFLNDFLYQTEWSQYLKDGLLTRLNTSFFDDVPNKSIYDIIQDNEDTFNGWLSAGAHLYLSGHKEIFDQLTQTLSKTSPYKQSWLQLTQQKRLHKNVY